ncbi:MAG: hypothetical protein HY293_01795 [Planctomycetes bacterium]|nr:hypothetical protein [Planctomycetota bacterium]
MKALRNSPWLNGPRWDLTWLLGTALVVPATLILVWAGISSDALNLIVTLLAGGPHVFATFLTTFLDPEYRRRHGRALALIAVLIPAVVGVMTVTRFQQLMSFFIFAASFHVLQQNAWLADAYRERAGRREPWSARILDYAVLFLSFYPIASFKLVHDDFMLGDIRILIPEMLKTPFTYRAVGVLFAAAAAGWILKTFREWRVGALNRPKTALILLTSSIAFLIPAAAAGSRLELAFQSVNAWHSLQYLSVIWLILRARKASGREDSRLLKAVGGPGRPTAVFYGLCLLFTGGLLTAILLLKTVDPLSLSGSQYYYMGVFSVLFIHYAFDGYFFFASRSRQAEAADVPFVVPLRG